MKAAVITAHGGPEVVKVQEIDAPKPAPGEVVVDVRAAALNHLDLWVRKGRPGSDTKFPHVLGSDAAGVVAAVGEGVADVEKGQEIIVNPALWCGACEFCRRGEESECADFSLVGVARPGTFAEQVAVPAVNVRPKPPHLDWKQAAALTLDHLTAWRMLVTRAGLGPGETVLIHGIGGGAALAGLQIARLLGAETFVTSSSNTKLSLAIDLGADHTLNYRLEPDVAGWIRKETGGRGVDVVFDSVGAATVGASLDAVRRGGRVVLCGVTTGAAAEVSLQRIYWNQLALIGSTMGSQEDLRRLLAAVTHAHLVPVVDKAYPLDGAAEAMARMEKGEQFGKIVLSVSE